MNKITFLGPDKGSDRATLDHAAMEKEGEEFDVAVVTVCSCGKVRARSSRLASSLLRKEPTDYTPPSLEDSVNSCDVTSTHP